MTLLWICFAAFILYFVGFETAWGLWRFKKIIRSIGDGSMLKTKLYLRLMAGLWAPLAVVVALLATGQLDPADIGLRWFAPAQQTWLFIASAAVAGLYLLYLVYSLIALRIGAVRKTGLSQPIPEDMKLMLPATRGEKVAWGFTALTAGVAEELLFRGFFFYLMGALFPALPVWVALAASTLIFGVGHLYQGPMEALKPMILGFFFGVFYIAFGSIYPCILLHTLQDLCATDLLSQEA